jgi:hypothetical protein
MREVNEIGRVVDVKEGIGRLEEEGDQKRGSRDI